MGMASMVSSTNDKGHRFVSSEVKNIGKTCAYVVNSPQRHGLFRPKALKTMFTTQRKGSPIQKYTGSSQASACPVSVVIAIQNTIPISIEITGTI